MRHNSRSRFNTTRRSRARFGALSLLLVFLGVLAAEAFAVRDCPHHLPGAGHAEQTSHALVGPAAWTPGDSHHHDEHGPCRCVGACHAGAAAPLFATGPAPVPGSLPSPIRAAPAARTASPSGATSYLLPYPNGPPSA